jgi:hypothetical protein
MSNFPLREKILMLEPDGRVHGHCPECGWDTDLVSLINSDKCAFCYRPASEHPDGVLCYRDVIHLCPACAEKSGKQKLQKRA